MDYEKAYKEALERAKKWANKYIGDWKNQQFKLPFDESGTIAKDFLDIFPELAESEDERIRKELISFFNEAKDAVLYKSDGELSPAQRWEINRYIKFIIYLEKQSGSSEKPKDHAEWSEEDEKMLTSALWHIKNSCGNGGKNSGEFEVYNWLKDLPNRFKLHWKPSEHQMAFLGTAIEEFQQQNRPIAIKHLTSLLDDLKAL